MVRRYGLRDDQWDRIERSATRPGSSRRSERLG
jgi:hypothetical protein